MQQANLFVTTWVEQGRDPYYRGRRHQKSITTECCSTNACTFEEFAEYCPIRYKERTIDELE